MANVPDANATGMFASAIEGHCMCNREGLASANRTNAIATGLIAFAIRLIASAERPNAVATGTNAIETWQLRLQLEQLQSQSKGLQRENPQFPRKIASFPWAKAGCRWETIVCRLAKRLCPWEMRGLPLNDLRHAGSEKNRKSALIREISANSRSSSSCKPASRPNFGQASPGR